jgi:hypothetical protein
MAPGNNGSAPERLSAVDVMQLVRRRPRNVLLLRGFGPLAVAVVLYLLMLALAPSVAPEHIVERPASVRSEATSTTVAVAP